MKTIQNKYFSPPKVLKDAWGFVTKNFAFLVVLTLLYFFLLILISQGERLLSRHLSEIMVDGVQILAFLGKCWLDFALVKIYLNIIDHKKPYFKDLLLPFRSFLYYICALYLYGLIVIGGTILLIVPGIIWALKFVFYPYFIVDKGLGPINALRASARLTDGVKWQLLGFWLLSFLIYLLGALCLIVGLLVAMPLIGLAQALIYRTLYKQSLGGEILEAELTK